MFLFLCLLFLISWGPFPSSFSLFLLLLLVCVLCFSFFLPFLDPWPSRDLTDSPLVKHVGILSLRDRVRQGAHEACERRSIIRIPGHFAHVRQRTSKSALYVGPLVRFRTSCLALCRVTAENKFVPFF